MKRIVIISVAMLFCILNLDAQEFPINKLEAWIAKGKLEKAQNKLDELLIGTEGVYSDEHAQLWLYRANSYSLSYFDKANAFQNVDNKSYLLLNKYVEEAIYSFKKAYKFGGSEIREKSIAQMDQLHRFFKKVANRQQELGNDRRFYMSARRARTCNLFINNKLETAPIDTSLIYILADAAELVGYEEEAISLRKVLISYGINDEELYYKSVALHLGKNDTLGALKVLDKGIKLHTKSKQVYLQKLLVLKELKMEKELKAFVSANATKFPSFKAELMFQKGEKLHREYEMDLTSEDLFSKAEKFYRNAVRFDKNNNEYIGALADLYYKKALRIKSDISETGDNHEKEYVQILRKARTSLSTALKMSEVDNLALSNALQFVNSENAAMLE